LVKVQKSGSSARRESKHKVEYYIRNNTCKAIILKFYIEVNEYFLYKFNLFIVDFMN